MSYTPNRMGFLDGPSLDAFGRLRVSTPFTQFESTNQYAPSTFANQLFWDSAIVGAGAVSPQTNECSIRLSTGGTTAANAATVQSKQHLLYQPGKSRAVAMTFVCGAAKTNSTFEIGYANANNGILFQRITGAVNTTNYITRRTYVTGNAVDTQVAQGSWNLDKLDGTGASGITIDFTETQILFLDLQFLGVGRVRVGFDIDGQLIYAHEFLNANSLPTAYMSTGSLPLRVRVINDGTSNGTLTADFICSTVLSEGGYEGTSARQFSVGNGITTRATSTTFLPLIAIRPMATFRSNTFRGHVVPLGANLIASSQVHEFVIFRNATLTKGGGAPTWNNVNATYSAAQYTIDADAISGGIEIDGDYLLAGGVGATAFKGLGMINVFLDNPLVQTSLNNTLETLTIAIRTETSTGTARGRLTWKELY